MASTNYSLGKGASFQANGRYPGGLDGADPKDPRPAIRRLIELFAGIQAFHRKITAADGQIVGVERSRLLDHVDAMIRTTIVLLRKHSSGKTLDLVAEIGSPSRLLFDFDSDGWSLDGELPLRLSSFQGALPEFYRTEFCPPRKAFLEDYKSAAVDGLVSEDEESALVPRLRDILLVSLKLYFLLYYMRINS